MTTIPQYKPITGWTSIGTYAIGRSKQGGWSGFRSVPAPNQGSLMIVTTTQHHRGYYSGSCTYDCSCLDCAVEQYMYESAGPGLIYEHSLLGYQEITKRYWDIQSFNPNTHFYDIRFTMKTTPWNHWEQTGDHQLISSGPRYAIGDRVRIQWSSAFGAAEYYENVGILNSRLDALNPLRLLNPGDFVEFRLPYVNNSRLVCSTETSINHTDYDVYYADVDIHMRLLELEVDDDEPEEPIIITDPTPEPVPEPVPEPEPPMPPSTTRYPKPRQEQQIRVNLYEYILGLYEAVGIDASYHYRGIYVSKPFNIPGNIVGVELDTNEQHPLFDIVDYATDQHTSIEYYITHKSQPGPHDWYPILPIHQQDIRSELLLPDRKFIGDNTEFGSAITAAHTVAHTRFFMQPDMPITLYMNGSRMEDNAWDIYPDFKQIAIKDDYFMSNAVYTVDYTPDSIVYNPWHIDILDLPITLASMTEEISHGPDRNGVVTLQHYPYVNHTKMSNDPEYEPILVTIDNAHIIGPDDLVYNSALPYHEETVVSTQNVTNYMDAQQPDPTPYTPENLTFEYIHQGNQLFFADNLKKIDPAGGQYATGTLQVSYQTLSPSIRMKIIMRSTSPLTSATPKINQYKLQFYVER